MLARSLAALLIACSFVHAQDRACAFHYPEGHCGTPSAMMTKRFKR